MPNMHEKPLPGVVSADFEGFTANIETERDYEEFMVEPAYGFDYDYDPMPDDIDTDDIDTDIPF